MVYLADPVPPPPPVQSSSEMEGLLRRRKYAALLHLRFRRRLLAREGYRILSQSLALQGDTSK